MTLLRLTPAHFALYQAYLEGSARRRCTRTTAFRGPDGRVTRRTLATLRDTLTIAAGRAAYRRRGSCASDARRLAARRTPVPTVARRSPRIGGYFARGALYPIAVGAADRLSG